MKATQLSSMLDLQTGMLAGMFILYVIVAVKVGTGGSYDGKNNKGGGEKAISEVVYEKVGKRKKDHNLQTVYVEFLSDAPEAKQVKLNLMGQPTILDSCTLSFSPFLQQPIWTGSHVGNINGEWGITVANPDVLKSPVEAKVHLLHGTQHIRSKLVTLSKNNLQVFRN